MLLTLLTSCGAFKLLTVPELGSSRFSNFARMFAETVLAVPASMLCDLAVNKVHQHRHARDIMQRQLQYSEELQHA